MSQVEAVQIPGTEPYVFDMDSIHTNRLYVEILHLLGLVKPDPDGDCDFVFTEAGADFFLMELPEIKSEVALRHLLADKIVAYRKERFENATYGMSR